MLFYLIPFVLGCVLLLIAVTIRPRLIYEFPYFMGAACTAFLLPQAYALYHNEWGGEFLEITLLMSSLCLAACWFGYLPKAHPALLEKFNVRIHTSRFFHGGVAFVLIGSFFMFLFNRLPEDDVSSTTLTGIGTIYLFFSALAYPGFAICLYCALKERRALMWFVTLMGAWVPIQLAVFYGRREPTALFLITLAMTLYFLRGKQMPRFLVIGAIVASALIIPAIGQYRETAKEDPIAAAKGMQLMDEFKALFEDEAISEFKNATVLIAATSRTGDYDYGAGYWNRIVFRFVPGQLVGKEFKESLMIGGGQVDFAELLDSALGYQLPGGSTVTGFGDAFYHFGYFGCLVFAVIAYFFKNLWTAANHEGGTVAQILYIQMTTTAMRAVTHQTMDFVPGVLYSLVFIGVVAWYARERPSMSTMADRLAGERSTANPPVRARVRE